MKSRTEILVPLAAIQAVPIAVIAWYRLHRYAWYRYSAIVNIGSDVLDFIKLWFIEPLNKTGCRFVIVDAYNTPSTMAFYEQNGFTTVFSTEQQEKDYRHITSETSLNTRLMFYDLMQTIEEYR